MTLDEHMKAHSITDDALARLADSTQPHVCRIRRGDRRASPELAKRIEAAIQYPAKDLLLEPQAAGDRKLGRPEGVAAQ
jgi:transcriptional regulator with XRE-family HTH domain